MPSRKSGVTWQCLSPECVSRLLFVLAFILFEPVLPAGHVSGASFEEVLASMDKAAASFLGVSATIRQATYTAVIKDNSEETGAMRMQRLGKRDVRLRVDFGEPDVRSVAFAGRTAEVYYPKIQTVQVYELGKHRELIDQFLLLGFGTSGRELQAGYLVQFAGTDTIGGEQTARLELKPKSSAVREHLSLVELWISPAGHPAQQKFHKPSGDHTTITYTGVRINPDFGKGELALKLPPGVRREYPQK